MKNYSQIVNYELELEFRNFTLEVLKATEKSKR